MSNFVIALLLSLALPALGRARARAESTQCLAALHSISQFQTTFSDQINKGRFPNDFEPETSVVSSWINGDTQFITNHTLDQTIFWIGPLDRNSWATRWLEDFRPYCPAAARLIKDREFNVAHNPQILPEFGYWYSAAMFTSADLWDPDHPERRQNPDEWRRSVGIHEVLYPDRKVVYFENGDFHGNGLRLGNFGYGQGHTNVVCVDGHTATVDPYGNEPALAVPWPDQPGWINFAGEKAMPFSSPAFGYRGRDW